MAKKTVIKSWLTLFLIVLSVIIMSTIFFYIKVRPLIYTVAKSEAETIMLNSSANAMLKIIKKNEITYEDISNVKRSADGEVQSIEIDTLKVNLLKNSLLKQIPLDIKSKEFYNISIPLGTLTGIETLSGIGPKISVPMQLTSTVVVNYRNCFVSEGINQTLHQILLNVDLHCNIVMLGFTQGFNVSTKELVAQTVIVGIAPDNFTNVIETPTDDIADKIFNFAN